MTGPGPAGLLAVEFAPEWEISLRPAGLPIVAAYKCSDDGQHSPLHSRTERGRAAGPAARHPRPGGRAVTEQPAGHLARVRAEHPDWSVRPVTAGLGFGFTAHRGGVRIWAPALDELDARISEVPAALLALLRGPG